MFVIFISFLIVAGSFTVLITWVEKKKSDFQTLSAKEQEEELRRCR